MSTSKPLHCISVRSSTLTIGYARAYYMTRNTKQLHFLPNEQARYKMRHFYGHHYMTRNTKQLSCLLNDQARYAMRHFLWPPIFQESLLNRQFTCFFRDSSKYTCLLRNQCIAHQLGHRPQQ